MPGFGPMAWKLAQQADILHLHLPQFDAPGVAMRGRILGKPVVLTYHCDLQLPQGTMNRLVDKVVLSMNQLAGQLADAVVTYTRDYGTHSPFLSQYLDQKLHIIPPPVELPDYKTADILSFRKKHQLSNEPTIGIICRLATEKGVEVLLKALPIVRRQFPNVRVLQAGQYENIIGEEAYAARLAPLFAKYKDHYHLLGNIEGAELSAFFNSLDCLCVPSLNSTESFGLVQIEAMKNGVPVAACALPGVRQPVTMTGMGEVTAVGDHNALAQAIIKILSNKKRYQRDSTLIGETFSPQQTAEAYVQLFQKLQRGRLVGKTAEPAAYNRLRTMRDSYK
jgi:glycosyltransferase involved in cell wall biosynthesis